LPDFIVALHSIRLALVAGCIKAPAVRKSVFRSFRSSYWPLLLRRLCPCSVPGD
jgi:hypothetical protein